MFSKNLFLLAAVATLLLALTVEAQDGTLVEDLTVVVGDLTKISGAITKLLANPEILLNGELGENVGESVNRIVNLVKDLLTTVTDLLQSLGLASE